MGIDSKEFQAFMWRVLKFSVNICSTFAQKYPFASGVSVSLLVLYLFLPSIFYFLIYFLPFLGCTAVFIRFCCLNSQRPKIQHGVDERKEPAKSAFDEADAAKRDDNSSIEARRMLRRNVNKNVEESDAHAVKEETDLVSSMPSNDDFIGRTALFEEKPKVIMQKEKESCVLNSGESSSHNASIGEKIPEFSEASNSDTVSCNGSDEQPAKLHVGGDVESESSSSEADDDEEEESEKGGENAVEWTEYDQKNLMDLGDSELERNRRLESLIARRRARKSFKVSSRAAPGPVPPVLVARSNTFHVSKSSDDRIPSSAPSILLPTQNPFDLPYDPFEEKPNLMADSFQKEFMADHQKELHFCRHESFSLGNSFPLENTRDQHEGSGYSRSKIQLDKANHDLLVDHLLFQGGETLRRNLSITDLVTEEAQSSNQATNKQERDRKVGTSRIKLEGEKMEQSHDKDPSLGDGSGIQMDTDAIKHEKIWSSPSSSIKETFNAKTAENSESLRPTTFKFPEVFNNRAPNSLPCPVPKARDVAEPSYDSSPSAIDNTRMQEHFFYKHKDFFYKHKDLGHTPTNSIASDMQVEVSEIGSPPLTADGTASSHDGESLIYDGDSEKEITSGSEETWGASPLAPKVQEENENSPRKLYGVEEEDIIEEGFSRFRNEPEDPISSSMWSLSSLRAERSQEDQAHSMNFDPKNSNYVKHVVGEEREQGPSNSSDVFPPEHSLEGMRTMEVSMAHTPSELYFQKPQESLNASGNSAEEKSANCNADDTITYSDREDLKSNENRCVGAENSMMQEVIGSLSEPAEGSNSKSNSNIMSESLINPKKSVEGVEYTYNVKDSRFLKNDQLEDLKSNEDRDSGDEKGKQTLIGDLPQPAVESHSESSKHIESKSLNTLNSPENSGGQANITYNVNELLVNIKDPAEDFESIDRDSERLAELHSGIQSILIPFEGEDNRTSTQCNEEDLSTIEVGVSGVNQRLNVPTASAILPELIVEQVSTNSSLSSSPKSVLAYRMPADIGSSSDFSQLVSTDMGENLPLPATQDTSHVVNDSMDHPSIDSKSQKSEVSDLGSRKKIRLDICECNPDRGTKADFNRMSELDAPFIEQEPSNTRGKSTEEAIEEENIKGSVLDDEETKENLSNRQNKGDVSETLINTEASIERSKPLEEINPRAVEQLEGASARLADSEASFDDSKPEGEHSNPKVTGLMEEKESTNLPRDIAGEVNLVSHVSDPSINKKGNAENLRSFEGSEGEPKFSTGQEIFVEPLKPADSTSLKGHDCSPGVLTKTETVVISSQAIKDDDNSSTSKEDNEFGTRIADQEIEDLLKPAEAIGTSETTKDFQGDPKDLTDQKAVLNTSKPAVDGENILVALEAKDSAADIIHNGNEPVAIKFISNEKFNHVQDKEDESQRFDRKKNIMEPLKAVEVTNSESTRDIEGESKKLAEDEVNVIPSQPAGKINSSNDRDNTEDPGKSIVLQNVMDISDPSKGNDSVRTVEDNKGKSEDNDEQIH